MVHGEKLHANPDQAGHMSLTFSLTTDMNHQRTEDRERAVTGPAESPAKGSGGRQLRHKEASRQADTDAPFAATQVNCLLRGEFVKRLTQAVRSTSLPV